MLADLPKPIQFKQPPQRVLLILPTWVGDAVMATPFITAVCNHFSEAQFTLVMHKHLASLLDGHSWMTASEQMYWPPKRKKSPESKAAKKAFVAALAEKKFDLAIAMPNSFSSAWLCRRIGARRRVGFNRDGRGFLLTDRIKVPNKLTKAQQRQNPNRMPPGAYAPLPLVEYYAHLAAALGCAHPGDQLSLFARETDRKAIDTRLEAAGVNHTRPRIVLCPGANFGASKCWSVDRFAQVADNLVQDHQAAIIIGPGPGEEPLAEAIANTMQQPSVLLTEPCTTLGELKALIASADLLLGNDTGPRHFARAFDVHRVTIFGPTEARWTDTSHDRETIVRVDVPCGPCHEKVCPLERQVCMEGVTVDMVTQACKHALTNP